MRRVWLCLALAACNPLFGLEETRLIDSSTIGVDDQDSDGVLDASDNCPTVANQRQEDIDGDLIGDVCDPCSFEFTPTLDRDNDGAVASADNCPTAANMSQTDGDGDAIGDGCDPNPGGADTVRCFADMATRVSNAWPIADPWKWLGTSSAYIFHQPSTATPFWLGALASGLRPSQIAVQVQLTAPSLPTTNVELANGVAVGAADQTASAACELVAVMTDTSLRLRLSDSRGPLGESALPFTTTHVTLGYRQSPGGTELTCTAIDATGARVAVTRTTDAAFDPSVIFLTATYTTAAFGGLVVYETL